MGERVLRGEERPGSRWVLAYPRGGLRELHPLVRAIGCEEPARHDHVWARREDRYAVPQGAGNEGCGATLGVRRAGSQVKCTGCTGYDPFIFLKLLFSFLSYFFLLFTRNLVSKENALDPVHPVQSGRNPQSVAGERARPGALRIGTPCTSEGDSGIAPWYQAKQWLEWPPYFLAIPAMPVASVAATVPATPPNSRLARLVTGRIRTDVYHFAPVRVSTDDC